jgi:hypothetical protein
MSEKLLLSSANKSVSREFVRAWRTWQRTPPPVENFRLGADEMPTWQIEGDLDHLCTWIYGLGTALFEGRRCNFARMAAEDLGELWRIELEVERLPVSEKEKRKYRKYIALTRLLLDEIVRCHSAGPKLTEPTHRPNGTHAS